MDLSNRTSIQTALFVKIVVPEYGTLTFSDYQRNITLGSVTYTGLGQLLSVTDTTSELRAANSTLSITVSGIPTQNITDFVTSRVKGSSVVVSRAVFDATTGALLDIPDNPTGRFTGLVNNYSLQESWEGQDSSTTITIVCSSLVEQLQRKISGRRTNPADLKRLNPYDLSFDRVPSLVNSSINFGA